MRLPVAGDRGGFTLLELLIVFILLSLSAGLLAPRLADRLDRDRLEERAGVLGRLLREAFVSAVFTGRPRWVAVAPNGEIAVFNSFPKGRVIGGFALRPFDVPGWLSVEGLERGWCASPEGFCDSGPIVLRDRERNRAVHLRIRPYDGEVSEE